MTFQKSRTLPVCLLLFLSLSLSFFSLLLSLFLVRSLVLSLSCFSACNAKFEKIMTYQKNRGSPRSAVLQTFPSLGLSLSRSVFSLDGGVFFSLSSTCTLLRCKGMTYQKSECCCVAACSSFALLSFSRVRA